MSQTYESILIERRDRVAIITINRPEKRNALNIQTRAEGAAALDEAGVVVPSHLLLSRHSRDRHDSTTIVLQHEGRLPARVG